MKVNVIRPAELGSGEVAAWREMQSSGAHLANPFLSPDFTIAMGEVRAEARVAVITESDGPVGFFPFERHGGGVGTALGGWVSLSQGVVHAPGTEFDSNTLLKECGLNVWEFGCMIDHQPWFQPFETLRQEAVVLDFADGYPAFLDELRERSPKFVKTTLYKERKLSRDAGEVTSEFAVRDAEQFRLLREWKSAQYQRMGRPDRFAKSWVVELTERLHSVDTPDFAGPLSMLYADGRPVAGHFGLRTGTMMIGWFPAYDPDYAKYSPGLIQHLHMVEAAAKIGVGSLDLGISNGSEYKDALCSRTVPVTEGIVRRRSAGAAAHWLRTAPVRRVRRFILDSPALYGAADRAMKRYGRLRTRGKVR
ncbi:GNAT family N-acetyltransferase [Streptosporangium sp. NBC_01755]|uniref:GNAT family N-acetyltransferase n=1 Tax=Streptosporangium sp. NBC_01755 TaxID=2975949 RepID=UPI002DDC78FE|nr:GNAT family N-acetyltransferase [Streptosporangium sp. NBC_01755]WSD00578.1 GNAT family N-acetyltransferase [Streptosporangium sp. NBC_01755]